MDEDSPLSKQFRYLIRKLSHFWNRRHKEYLVGLREAHKSERKGTPKIGKGDIVLLHDDNLKHGMWKTAIVEELVIGKDSVTRGARVRKPRNGKPEFICRSVQKLYPLEILRDKTVEERMDSEESERCEEVQKQAQRLRRASARDAQQKRRLMLDS